MIITEILQALWSREDWISRAGAPQWGATAEARFAHGTETSTASGGQEFGCCHEWKCCCCWKWKDDHYGNRPRKRKVCTGKWSARQFQHLRCRLERQIWKHSFGHISHFDWLHICTRTHNCKYCVPPRECGALAVQTFASLFHPRYPHTHSSYNNRCPVWQTLTHTLHYLFTVLSLSHFCFWM